MGRKYTPKKRSYKPRKKAAGRSRPKPAKKARKTFTKGQITRFVNASRSLRGEEE